jgi:hypothetical protein
MKLYAVLFAAWILTGAAIWGIIKLKSEQRAPRATVMHVPPSRPYTFIHMPPAGCPAGYVAAPHLFRRGDRDVPGCALKGAAAGFDHFGVDYLDPGEELGVDVWQVKPWSPR